MQEQDFNWFVENYQKLFAEYGHKFLAIKNQTVLGVYDTLKDGVRVTAMTETLGSFIVQECTGDASAYTAWITTPGIIR